MIDNFKITLLGTGTSVGIPALGKLGWGKCDPNNIKNKRQRCSILIQNDNTNILVDAGPDIKNQLIEHNIKKIDAVLITHQHSDHIAGLDELRPYYFYNKEKIKLYTNLETSDFLVNRFDYLFKKNKNSQSYFEPPLEIITIDYYQDLLINDISIKTIKQHHGVIDTLGFIVNNKFAYCTDVVGFPIESFEYLYNLDAIVITGLRSAPHTAHAHFDLTFSWIAKLKPTIAYLTHLSPDSDHDIVTQLCPVGVYPAFDGLVINI
ncbi:MBL fold metallo-hydrolase [Alphaproteobacteria bacterium]|nr:MBL fold metallo-hydrolase [Alphaproteobacteria bacterium]MDC1023199.1 MBL fold metallo-hydrolase [Alphaproteobacteria bacterium]